MKIHPKLLELVNKGEITTFFGKFATGKTTFALIYSLYYTLTHEGFVIFIDSEKSFSPERALQISNNKDLLDRILIFKADSLEALSKIVQNLQHIKNKINLVVIDSLGPLYRSALEESFFEIANDDLRRILVSLKHFAKENKIPIVITTQVYELPYQNEKFALFSSTENLVGGSILENWSNTLVWLRNYKNSNIKIASILKPKKEEFLYELEEKGVRVIS